MSDCSPNFRIACFRQALAAFIVCLLVLPAVAWGQSPFELQDFLNRQWSNEWVTFPASADDIAAAKAGHALVDKNGQPTLYQLTQAEDGTARLGLLANIDPMATQAYHFDAQAQSPASDLRIEQLDEHTLRLQNSLTGIVLTTNLQGEDGPIKAIRLASGKWVGGSQLIDAPGVISSSLRIVEQGPAMARAELTLNFADNQTWRIEARIQANEPVVHLTETFNFDKQTHWLLDLHKGFEPDQLYHRRGKSPDIGTLQVAPVATKDKHMLFYFEPWLHWWQRPRQGTWFGLYDSRGSDMLAIAACEADRWVEPGKKRGWNRTHVAVTQTNRGPQADFPLEQGQRVWLIASLDKDVALKPFIDDPKSTLAPLPQQYQIKHGEFPLERINQYTLTWPDTGLSYPRLYLTTTQLAEIRHQPAGMNDVKKRLANMLKKPEKITAGKQAIELFIRTGDETLGRKIAEGTLSSLQNAVDVFTQQKRRFYTLGYAPHHRRVVNNAIGRADLVLGTDLLTAQQKQRIKAQVAFLGYTTAREDYWSPARGFSATANMTSTVMSFQVACGSLISDHPQARQWVENGLTEFDRQLFNWTDEEGGSLEAPHYSMVTYNYLLSCYVMAYNAGISDKLFHDRMRKIGLMYARISTPPDPRAKGLRHLPPVGNTYFAEPSGQFATIAYLWREKDPAFSAHMRWMFEQQGKWPQPGVGGAYAPLSTVRSIFNSFDLPAKAPTWGSKLFPGQGVVLHTHMPSDRETQLYLISGRLHEHYDYDSGSITFWGKGSPFIDDFGYNSRAPASQHSMFTATTSKGGGRMTTNAFAITDLMDYTAGRRQAATRQLMLVKDDDPLGMNYLVMRDSLASNQAADGDWRVWLDVESVTPNAHGALASGHWDVDLDIHMLSPQQPRFTTEELAIEIWGVKPDGKYGLNKPARTGLITPVPKGSDVAAVLFPRLKDETPPVINSLNDGRVVKVRFKDTTDYIFLSQDEFEHEIDGITFRGTVGIARLRDGQARLALGAPGSITHGSQSLEKPQPTP